MPPRDKEKEETKFQQEDQKPTQETSLGWLYDKIIEDEDARVCKDISDEACHHLPRNFFSYLFANLLTKIADELSSARLILPWLLGALGAPTTFAGFLVPIRESGVLIPQLVVGAYARRLAKRKVIWILGAGLSSAALVLMGITASGLQGSTAGWSILVLLALFSLARGLCSVSAKDVVGKTISKTRRGALMGYSAGISGVVTLILGIYINFSAYNANASELFPICLFSAALLWVVAIAFFAAIKEEPGAVEGGANALLVALESLAILRTDPGFRRYVIARTFLLTVALVPPFMVLLAQQRSQEASGLGLMIIASGLASSLSAPFWGRMSDRSSRSVMVQGALGAAITCLCVAVFDMVSFAPITSIWFHVVAFFLISLFHSGVRLGRKVYLIDLSDKSNRSQYVAVSNTAIGVIMLLCGGVGVLGDTFQTNTVIGLLGIASFFSALYIARIRDVSG